jgi:hypothetical protein
MKSAVALLAAGLVAGLASSAVGNDLAAEQRFTETGVAFDLKRQYGNVTLTLAGPNGFYTSASTMSGSPEIDLRRFGPVDDGTYTYHLTASTDEKVKVRTRLDDGRDTRGAEPLRSVATSGTFQVKDGVIVKRVAKPDAPTGRDRQD